MSIVSMCRLCLYTTSEYFEFTLGHDPDEIFEKIQKFLYLQIGDDDPFPRTICHKCMDRLRQFNEFYLEVLQNQEILQYSQPLATENGDESQIFTITSDLGNDKVASTTPTTTTTKTTNLIHLTPGFNFKGDGSGNYILTLQTSGVDSAVPVISHESPVTIDLHQFISTNEMHSAPVAKFETHTSNSSKSIQVRSTGTLDASELTSFSFDSQTTAAATTTPFAIAAEMPISTNCTERQCANETPMVSRRDIKQEPTHAILKMKQDLDNLQNDEHDSDENNGDNDEDDDGDGEIETNDIEVIDEIDLENEKFNGFPKLLIKDAKLMIRGKQLVELISKFYRLECDLCEDVKKRPEFSQLSELYHHYVSEHTMKGYVICCGSKLIQPRAMALHMARHLQPDAFKCPQCDKMLTCPKILQYHIQNHLPEAQRPLPCPMCPRRFSYSSALVAHSITHQPEDERAAHVCDECGKTFASAGRLTTHVNVAHMLHGQDFICHICAKQFACRSNLSYHLTTHQPKVRKVQCDKCDKWLKNKLCLRKHMLQHSTIRYTCTSCNYSALNRQCLRNHIRVHHTDGKPFSCDVCGKSFKLKNTLLNHMVQHTGVRKFSCPFCSRTFASSGNYYTHRKRMHPQELAAMQLKQEEDERKLREDPTLTLQCN